MLTPLLLLHTLYLFQNENFSSLAIAKFQESWKKLENFRWGNRQLAHLLCNNNENMYIMTLIMLFIRYCFLGGWWDGVSYALTLPRFKKFIAFLAESFSFSAASQTIPMGPLSQSAHIKYFKHLSIFHVLLS